VSETEGDDGSDEEGAHGKPTKNKGKARAEPVDPSTTASEEQQKPKRNRQKGEKLGGDFIVSTLCKRASPSIVLIQAHSQGGCHEAGV
jgi:hypothetical protein